MSTSETGQSGGSVTLDQLIALNDEMTALVRAGVPLERGLIEAGRDLRGRLGEIATDLGGRLGRMCRRLPEALAAIEGHALQFDLYRAVVEAGLRSGRLAQALEGMATMARGYADARRAVGIALLYPLIVLGLTYALALTFIIKIAPKFVSAFDTLGLAAREVAGRPDRGSGDSAIYWAPILPAMVLLLLLVLRCACSGRSVVLDSGPLGPVLDRLPLIGSMSRNFRAANFAELLALLIEHHVPLDEAVRLAGDASGAPDSGIDGPRTSLPVDPRRPGLEIARAVGSQDLPPAACLDADGGPSPGEPGPGAPARGPVVPPEGREPGRAAPIGPAHHPVADARGGRRAALLALAVPPADIALGRAGDADQPINGSPRGPTDAEIPL